MRQVDRFEIRGHVMILRVLAWRDMLVQPTALFAPIILMPMKYTGGLTWFRRDLRAGDNAALAVLPTEERQDIPSLQDLGFEKPDPSALKMPAGSVFR